VTTKTISKFEYEQALKVVNAYRREQKRLGKYSGKSVCPFCGGCKTAPYVRYGQSQDCNFCEKNGQVNNRKLAEYDLQEFIEKEKTG